MKIQVSRELLLHAFQTVSQVAPKNTPKEILKYVRLDAKKAAVTLMATDLEVGVRMDVEGVEVEEEGIALLPVGRFNSILREGTDDKLYIETSEQGAIVKGDRSTFKLPGADPHEFPEVAGFTESKYHQVSARVMREIIRRTAFATDPESARYALGGVLFEMEADKILGVGTDGRRLAKMEAKAESVGGHQVTDATTIIPTRSLQLIEKALGDADSEVRIASRSNDVIINSSMATIFTRLVEGRFPKWRDVFPKRTDPVKVELSVGPVFSALRQAAVVASDDSRGINFVFSDGTLVLTATTADVGESHVELPITYTGKELKITLDHRYLADFLKVLDPEKTFTMELESSDTAALCSTDDGYGYVVMPLARDR